MSISFEQFRNDCPAAFAESPASHVSDRYTFVRTCDVVAPMIESGFVIDEARNVKAHKRNPLHGLHRVKLSHPDIAMTNGLRPQLIIHNSHNHASIFSAAVGMLRLVCTNGLVVGSVWGGIAFRHQRSAAHDVGDLLTQFSELSRRTISVVEDWNGLHLTDTQVGEYAARAARLRFGEKVTLENPRELLSTHRSEDDSNTLWTTYNRVQENGTHGGIRFSGMRRRSRALQGIMADTGFNRDLWNLTEEFAREVAAG